ncbi:hypothetical protein CDD81_4905 [Ophiocordyceps australis]|uniref:Zn(2)-C6 fungal-type domain-containing protein n=1 Tax=Ophiocordyceps australis TaxID=1399860 RepID=A0A2C5XIS6_9HYPO|nr:hypothetical protein CDD81_4905 [Ophiocordyceps australis]
MDLDPRLEAATGPVEEGPFSLGVPGATDGKGGRERETRTQEQELTDGEDEGEEEDEDDELYLDKDGEGGGQQEAGARAMSGQGGSGPRILHEGQYEEQQQQQEQEQEQQQDHGNGQHDGDNDAEGRKPRACEACRGLKVRCEPAASGPCKRCGKAGRRCVVTQPTRKRQRKTDSRVTELERKIDALTASLQARVAAQGQWSRVGEEHRQSGGGGEQQSSSWARQVGGIGAGGGGGAGGGAGGATEQQQQQQQHHHHHHRSSSSSSTTTATKRKAMTEATTSSSPPPPPHDSADIVDRHLVSMEKAAELFARYKECMVRHLPAVVFDPSMTAAHLRHSKPYLFLSIMAAASAETYGLQRVLHKELMQLFAHKVVVVGEKNLELVQAMQVACIWYWPPEHFEELKFYQLVHMAAVMALDIGLGRRPPSRRALAPLSWREKQLTRLPQPDLASIECRRAWLVCHFLAVHTSMSLHRPNLIRWSAFMTESLELLATSPDAAPTDKYLCHFVEANRMGEAIGLHLSMDDGDVVADINESRTQFTLRGLEHDLEKCRAAVTPQLMHPTLAMTFDMISLYMHERALHAHTSTEHLRSPFNPELFCQGIINPQPLSAAHIAALSACLTAIDSIFATFMAMDVAMIRCLPVLSFVRVAYALVVLIKMYFSARNPASELGRVIDCANMRVGEHLDALVAKFGATAARDSCRPAAKFLVVLTMLRSWFVRRAAQQSRGVPPGRPDAEATPNSLHVLSDAPAPLPLGSQPAPAPPTLAPLPHPLPPLGAGLDSASFASCLPPGIDFGSLASPSWWSDAAVAGSSSGDDDENGINILFNEPWFNDIFQGLPDSSFFPL